MTKTHNFENQFACGQSLHECDVDLDTNTFVLLWEYYSKHKNSIIYIRKHEGLYQNKVNSSLVSFCYCKWPILLLYIYFF